MVTERKIGRKGERDSYGQEVDPTWPRHPKCRCHVPCQKKSMYTCECALHEGDRMTPYCNGCDDEADRIVGPLCDTCWFDCYSDLFEEAS